LNGFCGIERGRKHVYLGLINALEQKFKIRKPENFLYQEYSFLFPEYFYLVQEYFFLNYENILEISK
jgi:hypothetical protein